MPTKHGFRWHPLYSTWDSMMQRCNNPKCTNYKNYGARGIKVSIEFQDCKVFIQYIQSLPDYKLNSGLQVDRIENDGHYERGNLKLSTRSEQNYNKRTRSDSISGYKGVSPAVNSKDRWRAYIYVNQRQVDLGIYGSIEAAIDSRNEYIRKHNLPHKIQFP